MKKIVLYIFASFQLSATAFAQTILKEVRMPINERNDLVKINFLQDASIYVEGYSGSDLIVQAINPLKSKQTGLDGKESDLIDISNKADLTLSIDQDIAPSRFETKEALQFTFPRTDYKAFVIRVPLYLNFKFAFGSSMPNTEFAVRGVSGKVDLSGYSPLISLSNIKGRLNLTAQGNGTKLVMLNNTQFEDIQTTGLNPAITISVEETDVDISVTRNDPVTVNVTTSDGNIYVDKKIKEKDVAIHKSLQSIRINGGGSMVNISTGYGNVVLREQNQ
ncbi:MAG TPA: hypothetical protein VKB19_00200 [Pedobacter sp.]|nr:hypothetical protein [Pedobacter sp.]